MSEATIRAAIKTLLESVTGIGKVNDYDRWANELPALKAMFKTNPADNSAPLHGWEITRESVPSIVRITSGKYKITHGFSIKGYYALKDDVASEKLFQLVIDAILQKFIDTKLANTEGQSLPSVSRIIPYSFAGTLCHHAEIKLQVSEIMTKTAAADEDLLTVMVGQYLDPATVWVMWKPATAYALNAIVVPPVPNGRKYKCTVAGISGAAEPVWPVVAGGTVADGTTEWTEDGAVISQNSEIDI